MHTGAHLINATTLESELYYDKHGLDNLVYGCDWKCNEIVATCSFYNHNLEVINFLKCFFFQMWVLFDETKSGIFYELELIDITLLYGQVNKK